MLKMPSPFDYIGNIFPSPVGAVAGIAQIMQVVVYLGIFVAVIFLMFKFKLLYKFPVQFDIFQVKNRVLQLVDTDRGRRVKGKDNREYFDIKKRNFKWYPPSFEGQVVIKGGKKSKIYVVELSHNDWEIIDPASFIKAEPTDYKRLEKETLVRYWKNVEDDKADLKWRKEDKWKKIMDAMPTVIMFVGIGIFLYFFGNYVVVPVMGTFGGVTSQSQALLAQSIVLLEKSTQYVEMLLRLNNIQVSNIVGNASVIP